MKGSDLYKRNFNLFLNNVLGIKEIVDEIHTNKHNNSVKLTVGLFMGSILCVELLQSIMPII